MTRFPFVRNPKLTSNTTKFDQLTYSNNALHLQYRDQPKIEISFSDIEKIYIKKHKLNPILEFMGIAFPFMFVFMAIQYFPLNLLIFVSIISILPVFVSVINYKWYRLYVRLYDGTSFRKKISLNLKTENFSILEKVRAEYISYNYNCSALAS